MVGFETLAVLAAVSAVSAVVSSGVAWLFRGSVGSDIPPDTRQRRISLFMTVTLMGPLIGLLVLAGLGSSAVTDAFGTDLAEMALLFWAGLAASLPGLVAVGVTLRRGRLDEPLGELVRRAVVWVGLSFGTLFALLGVPVAALLLDATAVVPLFPLPAFVVTATLLGLYHRRQIQSVCAEADLTPEERQLVSDVLADTGFDTERVFFVTDEDGEMDMWRPWAKGFGPFRYVYVSRQAFDTYDEETLEALLYTVARPTGGYLRTLGWGVWFSLLVAAMVAAEFSLSGGVLAALLLAVVVFPFVLYAAGRRRTFRIEDEIADIVGGETVRDTLVAQYEYLDSDSSNRLQYFFMLAPSDEARIRRLEERYDLDSYFDTGRDNSHRRGRRDEGRQRPDQRPREPQPTQRANSAQEPRSERGQQPPQTLSGQPQRGQRTAGTGGYGCPNCGAETARHDRFCQQCGVSLADAGGR